MPPHQCGGLFGPAGHHTRRVPAPAQGQQPLWPSAAAGKYVGSAFITMSRDICGRLWKCAREHADPVPKGMKRLAALWVKSSLIGCVKHLRRQEDLRYERRRSNPGIGKSHTAQLRWFLALCQLITARKFSALSVSWRMR